jgi:hypothetical protein
MPGLTRRIQETLTAFLFLVAAAMPAVAGPAAPARGPVAAKPPASQPARPAEITDAQLVALAKTSKLTSDALRAGLEYVQSYKPILAREILDIAKSDPAHFRTEIRQAQYQMQALAQLRRSSPERYARQDQMLRLQAQADLLVERYNEAGETEKPHVEVNLTNVLGKVFNLRLDEERYELEQLRKQVDAKEERIKTRSKNKDRIVDRELTRMLGIDAVIAW